jgi:hypothetical protein
MAFARSPAVVNHKTRWHLFKARPKPSEAATFLEAQRFAWHARSRQ